MERRGLGDTDRGTGAAVGRQTGRSGEEKERRGDASKGCL